MIIIRLKLEELLVRIEMGLKSIKKNTFYNVIKTFSSIAFPLITFPYISRTLLVENLGKVNFGLSFISYYSLVATLGISVYAIKECSKKSDNRKQLSKIASEIYSLNIITTVIAYIVLFLTIVFYKKVENYRLLIFIQSFTILFTTLGTDWLNTAMEDFKYITIRTVGFQFLSLLLMFLFVHTPEDYLKYAIISVISTSGANILNLFYRKRFCDVRFIFDKSILNHLKPSLYLFVMILAQNIFSNVDVTMLGIIKGDYDVGIYTTAHKISSLVAQVITSILWVILPRMSLYFSKKDNKAINDLINKIYSFTITLGLPIVVGIFMISNDVILVIAGINYLPSVNVLKILIVETLLTLLFGSLLGNMVLLPANEERFLMILCVITAIFNVITNYLLIPQIGAVGAAVTTLLSTVLFSIIVFLKSKKYVKIRYVNCSLISSIIGCIVIVILCILFSKISNILLRNLFTILISVILYMVMLLLLKNDIIQVLCIVIKNRLHINENK